MASVDTLLDSRLALSISEFVELSGLSRASVLRAVKAGEIRHNRVGRRVLIPTSEARRLCGYPDEPAA